MPILIPGVGAQGGAVEEAVRAGVDASGAGIIVSASRGITYASKGPDFAEAARRAALKLRDEINKHRRSAVEARGPS
jgi:orotidine-5'-phosphate decarboxylase